MAEKKAPRVVWVVLDASGLANAFLTKERAARAAEVWDRVHPRYAPHRVVKYVAAPAAGKAGKKGRKRGE